MASARTQMQVAARARYRVAGANHKVATVVRWVGGVSGSHVNRATVTCVGRANIEENFARRAADGLASREMDIADSAVRGGASVEVNRATETAHATI